MHIFIGLFNRKEGTGTVPKLRQQLYPAEKLRSSKVLRT